MVYWAERYFEINGKTEKEKLASVGVRLNGSALSCLQWTKARDPFRTWESFQQKLLLRFRPTQEGSLCEKLLAIRQERSVEEYRRMFQALAAPLVDLLEEVLASTYINGLKPTIKAEVRLHQPIGLGRIMEMAQTVEERNQVMKILINPQSPKMVRSISTVHLGKT